MKRTILWTFVLVLALLLAAAPGAAFADNPPVVTAENFDEYFDNDGYLLESVTADTLILAGEFDNVVDSITLDRAITLAGSKTDAPTLTDTAFILAAQGVTLDGLTLVSESAFALEDELRDMITVAVSGATVKNMTITYKPGDEPGCAINARGEEGSPLSGLTIQNNTIVFETSVEEDAELAAAINLENVENAVVSGNTITVSTPVMNVNYNYGEPNWNGLMCVCPVRILEAPACEFTDNTLQVTVNGSNGDYPTSEAINIANSENARIQGNSISLTDTTTQEGEAVYLYGISCAYTEGLELKANSIDVSTTGGADDAGEVNGVDLMYCGGEITGNAVRCSAYGSAKGIYVQNYNEQELDLSIEDNTITVSAYFNTSNTWTVVSGVELLNPSATVKGNTIHVTNTNESYSDAFPVAGISCFNSFVPDQVLDIENNSVFTNGHYAVDVRSAAEAVTVKNNRLVAAQSGGDDAVYVNPDSSEVTIEDNTGALAAPVFSPEAGTYPDGADVEISCETEGAVIYYTLDGSDPTVLSQVYDGPIPVSETTTIKAFAAAEGCGGTPVATAVYTIPPVVTAENFYEYFDDDGLLLDEVSADTLVFAGEFDAIDSDSELPIYIILNKAITVTGSADSPAVLRDMGFILMSEGITLDGLTLSTEADLGDLIAIYCSDVTVRNMDITYVTSEPGSAIHTVGEVSDIFYDVVVSTSGVVIEDNTIYFETTVDDYAVDETSAAINLGAVKESALRGNTITTVMPAFLPDIYEHSYYVMGLSAVASLRFCSVLESEISGNTLHAYLNRLDRTSPTFEAMVFTGCEDVLFQGNSISIVDEFTPEGKDIFLYGAELVEADNLTFKENSFDISTEGGVSGLGEAAGLVVIASDEMEIRGNSFRCNGNGPVTAIYLPAHMGTPSDMEITGNTIALSGYCNDSNDTANLTGIELESGEVEAAGNTIHVTNKNETYDGAFPVAGIGCFSKSNSVKLDFNNNSVFTNGHYAVNFRYEADELTVTGNHLVARELGGDDAVYVNPESPTVTIENNTGALAAPVFSPEAGAYPDGADVEISCETEGAVIYYTLDGSDPTVLSQVYDGPIPVSETTTIKAFAAAEGYGGTPVATAVYTIPPVVTAANFFSYFDEDGALLESVEADMLAFAGEFDASDPESDLPGSITLDRAVTLVGSETEKPTLTQMGIKIAAEGVTLDGLTLVSESALGNLIDISADEAAVKNMTITYKPGEEPGCAINVSGKDEDTLLSGVVIEDNTIVFETQVKKDENPAAAISLTFVEDAFVSGNEITASTPGLDVDYSAFDLVCLRHACPVRILNALRCEFLDNTLEVTLLGGTAQYPTGEAMLIAWCEDALIGGNTVTLTDTVTPQGKAVYLYGISCAYNESLAFDENSVDVSTTGCDSAVGSITGVYVTGGTGAMLDNAIRCSAPGPSVGINLYDINGVSAFLSIEGNTITVSGYCNETDKDWGSVSGIEIGTTSANITGNTIYVTNTNEAYSDNFTVAGISHIQPSYSNEGPEVDIEDNSVFTNGRYAVDIRYPEDTLTVTGNRLAAAKLGADAAVSAHQYTDELLIEENVWPAAAPVFSPGEGLLAAAADVEIACETEDTVIHYTVNGDDPTLLSAVYDEPIRVSETTTIKAFAALEGFRASDDVSAEYTFNPPFGPASFTLPAALRTIGESAFEGDTLITVVDARTCTSIGANAFKGCTGLTQLKLPKDCAIDATAFTDCGRVYVYAPAGGTTESACAAIENCEFVPEATA